MRKTGDDQKPRDFAGLGDVIKRFDPTGDRYISREFQKYAYDLAEELRDLEHRGIYMRLAKTVPRHLLERARYFVKDQGNVKSPARLYMWKLKQLRDEWKEKQKYKRSLTLRDKN